jgi:hypothetical protein
MHVGCAGWHWGSGRLLRSLAVAARHSASRASMKERRAEYPTDDSLGTKCSCAECQAGYGAMKLLGYATPS